MQTQQEVRKYELWIPAVDHDPSVSQAARTVAASWKMIALVVALTLTCVGLTACKKQQPLEGSKERQLWQESDLNWPAGKCLMYKVALNERAPFYAGGLPMEWQQCELGSPDEYPPPLVLYQKFTGYRNNFRVNSDSSTRFVTGAQAVSDSGQLLADASLVKMDNEGTTVFEYQYDDTGALVFRCASRFDVDTGYKVEETQKEGQKRGEYFFVWPRGPFWTGRTAPRF
jgi:hypothetical protein